MVTSWFRYIFLEFVCSHCVCAGSFWIFQLPPVVQTCMLRYSELVVTGYGDILVYPTSHAIWWVTVLANNCLFFGVVCGSGGIYINKNKFIEIDVKF